jgi:hypothetical protein
MLYPHFHPIGKSQATAGMVLSMALVVGNALWESTVGVLFQST